MQDAPFHDTEGPPGARVTIRDVARLSGVSITTASRALNAAGRMSVETREKVAQVAAALNYQPSPLARGLVSRRSFAIGLMTDDGDGRFTLPLMAGIADAVGTEGVSTFLSLDSLSPDRMKSNLDAMLARSVDGLIITGIRIDRGPDVDLSRLGFPVVYAHSGGPDGAERFISDDFGGAVSAVRHIVSLGRRRIAHVSGDITFQAARLRRDGWESALQEAGLQTFGSAKFLDWSENAGYRAALEMFGPSQINKPDAVFCGSDQIARGMMDGLRHLGLEVPDDVAIVGYDNWGVIALSSRPPLTTVDLGMKELGRRAGKAMLNLIDGKSSHGGTTIVPCELVIRQSCGAEA